MDKAPPGTEQDARLTPFIIPPTAACSQTQLQKRENEEEYQNLRPHGTKPRHKVNCVLLFSAHSFTEIGKILILCAAFPVGHELELVFLQPCIHLHLIDGIQLHQSPNLLGAGRKTKIRKCWSLEGNPQVPVVHGYHVECQPEINHCLIVCHEAPLQESNMVTVHHSPFKTG